MDLTYLVLGFQLHKDLVEVVLVPVYLRTQP